MSMKPGATQSPAASISGASVGGTWPTAAMRPSSIATSPTTGSAPVPSKTVPFRITRSTVTVRPDVRSAPDGYGSHRRAHARLPP